MSDPVKNAEVEDVLSSIRRLVSEEKRPLQAAAPEPEPAPEPAPVSDRLVLTPALRVEEKEAEQVAEAAPQEDAHTPEPEADAKAAEPETAKSDADQGVYRLEAKAGVEEKANVEAIAENYDDDPYNFDNASDDGSDVEENIAAITAEDAGDDVADAQPEGVEKSAVLSAKIAALETAIGDISDEWEPDGSSPDAYAGTQARAMAWEDDIASEDDVASEDGGANDVFAHDVKEVQSQPTQALREASVEDAQMQQVAEGLEAEPAETTLDGSAEPDEARQETSAKQEHVDHFDLGSDDQLLDEDTLRDMVSEIVQSELQGALGERITRNVRRLVRREIHRALTARDLD